MFSPRLTLKAKRLLALCEEKNLRIATAESCTGGLIAALLTEIPGSSTVFDRGFVTYSNDAKCAQLGVPMALIKKHGAVSAQVAEHMAKGAIKHSKAHIGISVTGIAGPSGGTKEKPVGLVYIAIAHKGKAVSHRCMFKGNRSEIRLSAVEKALALFLQSI